MRLKEINPALLKENQTSMPQLRFSSNGNIYLNGAAVDFMSGTKFKSILFHQDQDSPKDWYLSEDEKGFQLKSYGGRKTMYFISRKLKTMISDSIGIEDKSFTFRVMPKQVVGDGIKYKLLKL